MPIYRSRVTVPVFVPGGFLGQTAALATLSAAQVALDLGGSSLNMLRQSERSGKEDCRTRYLPALVVAEASTRCACRITSGLISSCVASAFVYLPTISC